MHRARFTRTGRRTADALDEVHLARSLAGRDDGPQAVPDDGPDDGGADTDPEDDVDKDDDDEPGTEIAASATGTSSPASPPTTLGSSTRPIPTLTAIAHTSSFPSSTKTAGGVRATSSSISPSSGLSTVTTPANRPLRSSTPLGVTTAIGSAASISLSSSSQTGSSRPQQSSPGATLGSPSGTVLAPGAKAGIAFGVIAAAALIMALCILLWKKRRQRQQRGTLTVRQPEHGNLPQSGSQSAIMADLMASAYAPQNGAAISGTHPSDEKSSPAPIPVAPSPYTEQQPQLRSSVASWLRRHHPLTLNPLSGRNSTASTARATISDASVPAESQQAERRYHPSKFISVWSDSTASAPPVTPSDESHPPVPPLPQSPTRQQDKTKFMSVWSESTSSSASPSRTSSVPSSYGPLSSRPDSSVRGTRLFPPPAEHQGRSVD